MIEVTISGGVANWPGGTGKLHCRPVGPLPTDDGYVMAGVVRKLDIAADGSITGTLYAGCSYDITPRVDGQTGSVMPTFRAPVSGDDLTMTFEQLYLLADASLDLDTDALDTLIAMAIKKADYQEYGFNWGLATNGTDTEPITSGVVVTSPRRPLYGGKFLRVYLYIRIPYEGVSVSVDILANGVSIFPPGALPTIASGASSASTIVFLAPGTFAANVEWTAVATAGAGVVTTTGEGLTAILATVQEVS